LRNISILASKALNNNLFNVNYAHIKAELEEILKSDNVITMGNIHNGTTIINIESALNINIIKKRQARPSIEPSNYKLINDADYVIFIWVNRSKQIGDYIVYAKSRNKDLFIIELSFPNDK